MGTIEPCYPNSAAEGRLVSDVSSGHRGNELEGSTVCRVDRDEVVTDVVNVHNSRTSVNTSLSPVEASCSLDHVEAARVHQCCNLQVPSEKEVDVNMSSSSSATEFPLLSQKIEQHDHHKSLQCLSNSEETPNGKIFGKVLTVPIWAVVMGTRYSLVSHHFLLLPFCSRSILLHLV